MDTIAHWKQKYMRKLPSEEDAIARNHAITATYAKLYLQNPDLFKWAGMAAFASHHVGIAMLPYKFKSIELRNLSAAIRHKSVFSDLNLIRHLNTMIYDDIAWVHEAYLVLGLQGLQSLVEDSPHYQEIVRGFAMMDSTISTTHKAERNTIIWKANTVLLKHEQLAVVQPIFENLGAIFQSILTFCASLDFNPSHLKTDWKLHSSFLLYMYLGSPSTLYKTSSLPNLTIFKQRWKWLENRVVKNWRKREKIDGELMEKFNYLSRLG
jgi:hypothetical protein